MTDDPAHTTGEEPGALSVPEVYTFKVSQGANIGLRPVMILLSDSDDERARRITELAATLPFSVELTRADRPTAHASIVGDAHDIYLIAVDEAIEELFAAMGRATHPLVTTPIVLLADAPDRELETRATAEGVFDVLTRDELTEHAFQRTMRLGVSASAAQQLLMGRTNKLEKILANAPITVIVLNAEGVPFHSEGRPLALPTTSWREIETPVGLAAAVRSALAGEATTVEVEAGDANYRLALGPLMHEGVVGGVYGIATDVTASVEAERARVRAQEELRRATSDLERRVVERTTDLSAALEQLNRQHHEQRRFIADASHDFRTPLTAIRGETDLLARQDLSDDVRSSLDAIRAETTRLESLAAHLLILATLDAGAARAHHDVLRLDEPLLDAVAQLRRRADEQGVVWMLAVDDEIVVRGDAMMLTRAIANVLDNAISYSPAGATIDVRLARSGDSGRLTVTDHGAGIDERDLAHVFDRFFRGAATRDLPGSGLGLSIVRSVVEAHGGAARIASVLGQGTTVTIDLPIDLPIAREHDGPERDPRDP